LKCLDRFDKFEKQSYVPGFVYVNIMNNIKFLRPILFVVIFLLNISCEKKPTTPVLGVTWIYGGTATSVTAESYLLTDGGSPVTKMGICWNTSKNPTTANKKSLEKGLIGSFSSTLTPLLPNTLYYIRAFATNKEGTGYGYETTYTTGISTIFISDPGLYSLTQNTAVIGINISSDPGTQITARGSCWSTMPHPTINSLKTINGTGFGGFESTLTGLTPQTRYFIRPYAETGDSIVYGDEYSFKTYYGSVTDIENNQYFSILLGNQEWMAANLKVKKYNNGDTIGTTNPVTLDIQSENTPEYQWAYNGEDGYESVPYITNASVYGRLYTWYAVTDSRKICPVGWHVPNDNEWSVLIDYLGGDTVAGAKIKEGLNIHWVNPEVGVIDETGFDALLAGYRDPAGSFLDLQRTATWWSGSSYSSTEALQSTCSFLNNLVIKKNSSKSSGSSIRCIKD
jgi:uncharacterized protein (TIGR02145 family)